MKFSRCYSYRKDTCYYDEYIAMQYVSNKLEGRMTASKYYWVWNFVVDTAIYIIQLCQNNLHIPENCLRYSVINS